MSRRWWQRRPAPTQPARPSYSREPRNEPPARTEPPPREPAHDPLAAQVWRPEETRVRETSVAVQAPPSADLWDRDEGQPAPPPPSQGQDLPIWTTKDTTELAQPRPAPDRAAAPQPRPGVFETPQTPRPFETRPRETPASKRTTPTSKRSRRAAALSRRIAVVLVAVAALAYLADLGYTGVRLKSSLEEVNDRLQDGRADLEVGNLAAAAESFETARDASSTASDLAGRPALSLTSHLPLVGRDAGAMKALPGAADLAVRAATAGVKAGEVLGVTSEGVASSIYKDSRVQFDTLDEARPFVQQTVSFLARAESALQVAPSPTIGIISDAVDTALDRLSTAADTARRAQTLVDTLPSLLGRDGVRHYLLAFQALGEARGTGGLIGLYGRLKAENGKLELLQVGPIKELFPQDLDPVDAPKWFVTNYGPQSALEQVQQVNLSPNFPVVAKVLLTMFEEQTGNDKLDGVIAMDPVALSYLLPATGPLQVEGGPPITAENVTRVILRDSYLEFETQEEQNAYLSDIITKFWAKIRSGDVGATELASGLGEAVASQHLKLYARPPAEEEALATLGATGEYTLAGANPQLVFHNNYGLNKLDYYLRRTVDTHVQLDPAGNALVTTSVSMTNDAPPGPSSLLLGEGGEGPNPGTNHMLFNVLMPPDARVRRLTVNGRGGTPAEYLDEGHPVAWDILSIPPQGTSVVKLTYLVLNETAGSPFRMTLFPQATARPDEFSLVADAPSGYSVSVDGGEPANDFNASGELTKPVTFSIAVTPSD